MNIALYPNFTKKNALSCAKEVCRIFSELGINVFVDEEYAQAFSELKNVSFLDIKTAASMSEAVIAIGGDGTLLRCAKQLIGCDTKLLGINTGRLGFTASLEDNQLEKLAFLKNGQYTVSERMLLNCCIDENGEKKELIALNDICVSEQFSKICDFAVYSENYLIGNYRADGVLFSTPTGSTAYALSAGGPVIEPDLECIEMTLICPHSLFSRPMLFSADRRLQVVNTCPTDRESNVYISVDGEHPLTLSRGQKLEIYKSNYKIKIIDLLENSFHKSLGNKLMQSIK